MFWESVLGHRLAEIIMKELPRLNDNLEKIIKLKENEIKNKKSI